MVAGGQAPGPPAPPPSAGDHTRQRASASYTDGVETRPAAAFRGTRAVQAGLVTTLGAAGAHVLAGGALPGPVTLMVTASLGAFAAFLLAGRRLDRATLLALALLSQALLHVAYLGRPDAAGHGFVMLLGHAAAAAATVVVAEAGEGSWSALATLARRLLTLPAVEPVPALPGGRRRAPVAAPRGRTDEAVSRWWVEATGRRGPPIVRRPHPSGCAAARP